MKPVTLRKISPVVARTIQRRAAEKKISLNRAVLELLEESVGERPGSRRGAVHPDLDDLFGAWAPEEAALFQKTLSRQRSIDPELWS